MKDNKLIAEFMGVKPLVLGGSIEYEMYGVLDCIEDFPYEKHFFLDDEMRFHDSWDWLMPVLDKIKEIRCLLDDHDESFSWVCKSSDIEAEYNAVVEFIKSYNKGE
jgi:hypothetical protein